MSSSSRPAEPSAAVAAREEEHLRARWDQTQEALRLRFDTPLSRATVLTQRTLAWFPVRVWRHFLRENGFLLAAGVSYQALFASFAAIYVAFAAAGIWLGGSEQAIEALINAINSYIPGLIAPTGGLFTPDQVKAIANDSVATLGISGAIALGTLIWTAIGFVTYSRRAVRNIFALPIDSRSYILLKTRDLVAAAIFGFALLLGFVLTSAGTWALHLLFSAFGWSTASTLYEYGARTATLTVSFALFTATLAALFRFLTGASIPWRRTWPGAALGGAAITVLQIGAGWLLIYTPTNPLLATFAIFIGLLLWFRVIGIIILVAAAWIAVAANDRAVPLLTPTEEERITAEHAALVLAARVRLRTARTERATAPWYRRWAADRALREAQNELDDVKASAPPTARHGALFE